MNRQFLSSIDYPLLLSAIGISSIGIVTILPVGSESTLFIKQLIFLAMGILLALVIARLDMTLLRVRNMVLILYTTALALLVGLFIFAPPINGAQSWYLIGPLVFQPIDFVKVILIIFLAKYFSQRYIAIKNIRYIIISLLYTVFPVLLVVLQPDLGSAIILLCIWFGMVIVSGISKKHLIAFFLLALVIGTTSWNYLPPFQKERVITFVQPYSDLSGAGYNAYQSTIAVGSGALFGKGIGQGTQSKRAFLPEYESDFIFAAFAEEWGFVGVGVLFILYGVIFYRILHIALRGETNNETFIALGAAVFLCIQSTVHIGVNIGLLPVTGTTLPFMSYGGSHIIVEYVLLGILMSISRQGKDAHHETVQREFYGVGS